MTPAASPDDTAPILFHVEHPAATITLNRPARGNALTPELQNEFLSYLDRASKDNLIHYVILQAKGKYFCTGMDLSTTGSSLAGGNEQLYIAGRSFFEALESFPKPLIAIAHGNVYGGGCGIFFSADIRLASSAATFQLTEVTRGLVPALISPTIIREWGPQLARDAMLTARPISAKELYSRHIVSCVFDSAQDGESQLVQITQMLKRGGPKALQRSKALVRTQAQPGLSLLSPHDTAAGQAEKTVKDAFLEMMAPSEEAMHGILAFRQSKGNRYVDWLNFYKSKL
ncbi:ClpP/crotonase [Tilletiaria anomala UBC 951]|uniref:ClpP/crotonase n=1 Tax=Tilletiaria anomala (strain ATCC 24038 / CBS 436.72 / UBC 951) TaxID=1037660 RepID=A0A066WH54_TILAU|nr:ClpP/crotonase [Tilletiaria anomala UBC 951]KDN53327.1 ClpP/crotonase [Tilletiaria anomala UBC 951]